jgi:hypothetical protein
MYYIIPLINQAMCLIFYKKITYSKLEKNELQNVMQNV